MYKTLKHRHKPMRSWPANIRDPWPLDGDIPALQFINTCQNRNGINRKDYLKDYDDFLAWGCDIGLICLEHYNELEQEAYCYAAEAKQLYQKVINMREMLHELVLCIINDKPIHTSTVNFLNSLINEAHSRSRFVLTENGIEKEWLEGDQELGTPLWLIALHVENLLQTGELKNSKRCHCGNFYLDTSKGKARRWCNPLVCGNAARTRAYREKKKMM